MSFALLLLAAPALAAPAAVRGAPPGDARVFEFQYDTTIGAVGSGRGPLHVFVPLAAESDQQHVVEERIEASIPGVVEVEDRFGNRFWHGVLDEPVGEAVSVSVITTVERKRARRIAPSTSTGVSEAQRTELVDFLGPNAHVPVGHPILEPILAEIRAGVADDDPSTLARAIYDWVVDNVEYKKVGSGWGNGDTFWACSERYGNCTDFHALFISLARTVGIPARFEIGFPVPEGRSRGRIGGYHCWVEFYLPEVGWFPIDASEAFKHPEKRDFFYGAHPADRIHLSTGRDLRLGRDHRTGPLNYFVYPHVEVAGEYFDGPVDREFSYTLVEPGQATRASR